MLYRKRKREGPNLSQQLWIILACLWIVAASLGPNIPFGSGSLVLRPEDFLTGVMSGLAVTKLLYGRVRRNTMGVSLRVVLFALGISVVASLAVLLQLMAGLDMSTATGTFGYSLQLEILKEGIRFGKYILVAFAFSQVPYQSWKPVLGILAACCFIIIGIQVIQYIDAEKINPWLIEFYAGGIRPGNLDYTVAFSKTVSQFRSGSVMINPNVLGAYLIAPLFLFGMLLLESFNVTSKEAGRSRLLWLGLSGILWLGVFLTQSRTILLASLFGAMVSIPAIPRHFRRNLNRIGAWAIGAAVVTFAVFASTTYRFSVEGVLRGFTESLNIKLGLTLSAIQKLGLLIIVGAGPTGAGRSVDSEIGNIITWYGLIGLLLYFLFYRSLYHLILRRIQNVYLRAAFVGILAAYLLGAVGASFLLNNRVFPVFLAMLTIACAETTQRLLLPAQKANRGVGRSILRRPNASGD